jgi:hypothetical protein
VKGALHFEPGLYIIDGGEFNVNAGDNSKLTGKASPSIWPTAPS